MYNIVTGMDNCPGSGSPEDCDRPMLDPTPESQFFAPVPLLTGHHPVGVRWACTSSSLRRLECSDKSILDLDRDQILDKELDLLLKEFEDLYTVLLLMSRRMLSNCTSDLNPLALENFKDYIQKFPDYFNDNKECVTPGGLFDGLLRLKRIKKAQGVGVQPEVLESSGGKQVHGCSQTPGS